MRPVTRLLAVLLLAILSACGGSTSSSNTTPTTPNPDPGAPPPPASLPAPQHVVIVVFENQNYSEVMGSSVMPFFNSFAEQNAQATQFYANVHPSIGNYFMMTAGDTVTDDDSFSGTYAGDNIARQLTGAGKTWKVYAESLPSIAYVGPDVEPYVRRHNPFVFFDDVLNNPTQVTNIVPFSQFASDVTSNSLPNYSFVVPNNISNGHDCSDGTQTCHNDERLASIDNWFQKNFETVLANSDFMNSSVLIVTFDESANDDTNGGGQTPLVMAGGKVKKQYTSTTKYQFPSLLRFSLETLGVTKYPGAADGAPSMNEFLQQ
jgi:hypothetical protein